MQNKIDICLFWETKLDETFPHQQFKIPGYKVQKQTWRWSHFYINENILFKDLGLEQVPDDWTIVLIEFSIKIRKWLCISLYKRPSQNNNYFLDNLSLILNKLTCKFDNIVLMGDFNLTVENKNIKVFMSTFDLKCVIKKPTLIF